MTKKSLYEPLSSSSTEATNGRGQPSTAAHLDDDGGDSVVRDAGHHWYNVIITAIVFLYSMVMIHLLLIKCWHRNKKSELESCQVIAISTPTDCMASVLTVAAMGMLLSLGVVLFVFRPAWSDLAFIALMVSLG
ncbi:uncharacterized protein [Triticum aestivum]|uniref:uncharacterized protein n=1 Tax=Triticum aestivum TaxID=4565 RepID=UPI001D028997|nr:uncharacterized protein LOC123148715 [Triticum aestivum]